MNIHHNYPRRNNLLQDGLLSFIIYDDYRPCYNSFSGFYLVSFIFPRRQFCFPLNAKKTNVKTLSLISQKSISYRYAAKQRLQYGAEPWVLIFFVRETEALWNDSQATKKLTTLTQPRVLNLLNQKSTLYFWWMKFCLLQQNSLFKWVINHEQV